MNNRRHTSRSMNESMPKKSVETVGGNHRSKPATSYQQQRSWDSHVTTKPGQGPWNPSGSSKPHNPRQSSRG